MQTTNANSYAGLMSSDGPTSRESARRRIRTERTLQHGAIRFVPKLQYIFKELLQCDLHQYRESMPSFCLVLHRRLHMGPGRLVHLNHMFRMRMDAFFEASST